MKIVAFAQLRNELEKGNLENWFKCLDVCEEIYIFDQASNDGSKEFYKKYNNVHVIESPTNRFSEEIECKQELLTKLLLEQPDTDWIFWLDGDTLVDGRLLKNNGEHFRKLLEVADFNKTDCIILGHYNLWRSDRYYRTDNDYHWLHNHGVRALWKNTGSLAFNITGGLHQNQHPQGMFSESRANFNLIHKGFSTDEQIFNRYNLYKERGQQGYQLARLVYEDGLTVTPLEDELYPDWFVPDQSDPTTKKKIREIYEGKC